MSQRGLIIILCLSFPSSHRSTFTSWWRVTAMRAFCVRMLTRTYCWRRRRYMLERTCFHLLAPLDSRLLLAASMKVKILFPFFFFSFNKGMNTFVFFTEGMASTCTASAWVLGENMVIHGKSSMERCLPCTAVSQTQCRQYKLYYLFLAKKTVCDMRSRIHQSVH